MWYKDYEKRLLDWNLLRNNAKALPVDQCLALINNWWFNCPWHPYYLHWDDIDNWPDPWQLLHDNTYCDIARGLGILYTISLIDRSDLQGANLTFTVDNYTIVTYNDQYVLNWVRDSIINKNTITSAKRTYSQEQAKQRYN